MTSLWGQGHLRSNNEQWKMLRISEYFRWIYEISKGFGNNISSSELKLSTYDCIKWHGCFEGHELNIVSFIFSIVWRLLTYNTTLQVMFSHVIGWSWRSRLLSRHPQKLVYMSWAFVIESAHILFFKIATSIGQWDSLLQSYLALGIMCFFQTQKWC